MRISQLHIENLRCLAQVDIAPGPGLNLVTGANGAGKTSLLEAIHLLAYGRSFRGAVQEGVLRDGSSALRVVVNLERDGGKSVRLGLERGVRDWRARIEGRDVGQLSDLYREIAVVCFEPGSHALIGGGSEQRRRFVDWGVFHVEPDFLPVWRRYQRALKQRNALLKRSDPDPEELIPWERELHEAGEVLTAQRANYLQALAGPLEGLANRFLPEAGRVELEFQRGWPVAFDALQSALEANRRRDLAAGHTSVGPHRANWRIRYERLPGREQFSRGQEKLTALACVLAQAELHALRQGEWPILCLDDLASELDRGHLDQTLSTLDAVPAQIWLTGTDAPPAADAWGSPVRRFHVEQGVITPLI